MKRHEAFQAEKPMITGFQKYSARKKQMQCISWSRVGVDGDPISSVTFQKNSSNINSDKIPYTRQGLEENPR